LTKRDGKDHVCAAYLHADVAEDENLQEAAHSLHGQRHNITRAGDDRQCSFDAHKHATAAANAAASMLQQHKQQGIRRQNAPMRRTKTAAAEGCTRRTRI
jgi:hypothetical protein